MQLVKRCERKRVLKNYDHVIWLDDGGELNTAVHKNFESFTNFIGVEQTSRGFRCLSEITPKYPIANIARSKLKLEEESKLVGKSIIHSLLTKYSHYMQATKTILIIGNGAIGQVLSEKLSKNHNVLAYDFDPEKTDVDLKTLKEKSNEIDLVIGTTGIGSQKLLDTINIEQTPTVLASVSSWDIEFDAVKYRCKISEYSDCHRDITYENTTLLNSGFPINFHGQLEDGIPLKELQLTISLLLRGIFECITHQEKSGKLFHLCDNYQSRLLVPE